ncbi:hypothetical protein QW060_16890 [Myroides ceti]|uniref:Uncharacterized protein n=1 Tax=Paenimyroides ceti TaxID=395087 RepID=A0ABT8CXP8_9FLAO|nr:hypothetical protein [Paenimyroides ceti]MDN3708781.1 hypothetical protein [Paenimyroides ceti]
MVNLHQKFYILTSDPTCIIQKKVKSAFYEEIQSDDTLNYLSVLLKSIVSKDYISRLE